MGFTLAVFCLRKDKVIVFFIRHGTAVGRLEISWSLPMFIVNDDLLEAGAFHGAVPVTDAGRNLDDIALTDENGRLAPFLINPRT